MPKTLILIDGNALAHRAFHALPPLTDIRGRLLNAVYGFSSILLKVLKELQPDYVAATFDLAGPTFRHKEFNGYKATRVKPPDEFYQQLEPIKEVLRSFNIPVYEKQGFEADDIIGTIVTKISAQGGSASGGKNQKLKVKSIITTGDLDTLQLVKNNSICVYTLKKGIRDTILYDEQAVNTRYGLTPSQMADFKGLKGDPSDNIPGVPGVGEKTAISLLKQFGSLENLYKVLQVSDKNKQISKKLKEKLLANKDQAFFSKYLATIKTDVPIKFNLKDCQWQKYDIEKVKQLFKNFEFYSLVKRLPQNEKKEPEQVLRTSDVLLSQKMLLEEHEKGIDEKIGKLYQEKVLSEKVAEVEKKLVPVIEHMQQSGIKIDADYLKKLGENFGQRIAKIEQKIYRLIGAEFNISSPQQLSQALFEKLKLDVKGLRKTPGKVVSTAASELEKLRGQHSVIDLILEHRQLTKLKSTYTDGLIKLINPKTGRLHTEFDQLGTATGRFSSKNPNLQNIPTKTRLGNEIRKAFVAQAGWLFVSADYSQLELRVVASVANDEKMIRALSQGQDIHILTASEVFEVRPENVTHSMRRAAKALNFGVIYGMSIHGFSESAGIRREKAKLFIKKYFEEFKGIAQYIENIKKKAATDGYVETIFGRRRYIPEINSSAWNLKQAAERMAINMPIQGTAADLVKMAMIKIYQEVVAPNQEAVKMLLQVHDELVFEIKSPIVEKMVGEIKQIMENIYQLKVPLLVEIKTGKNWGEMRPLSL